MSKALTPTKSRFHFGWHDQLPDDLLDEGYFIGIRFRRIVAYLLDLFFIGLLLVLLWTAGSVLVVMTFGLFWPVLVALTAILGVAYNTFTVGSIHAATWGMRIMGVKAYSFDGRRPDYVQALVAAIVFYVTVPLTYSLILLVSLFNPRGRLLHDYLSGLIFARDRDPLAD